jgi:DNA-binding NarL/FixJ family response regulator
MLTDREREILQLAHQGLSDYKIARKLHVDAPSITFSRKNALKKLKKAEEDLQWAREFGYGKIPRLTL